VIFADEVKAVHSKRIYSRSRRYFREIACDWIAIGFPIIDFTAMIALRRRPITTDSALCVRDHRPAVMREAAQAGGSTALEPIM